MALQWEVILEQGFLGSKVSVERTAISGGWLVTVWDVNGRGITFVPDANHE